MTFVPYVPPPQPSPKAHDLANRLKSVIEAFRQQNPGVTTGEIQQAISMASASLGPHRGVLAALILVGVIALGGFALAYSGMGPQLLGSKTVVLAILVGVGVLAAALAAVLKRR